MKNGWKKTTLGEAFTTVTGTTPPKGDSELYGKFMPFVKPPELCDAEFDSAADGLSEAGAGVARTVPPKTILVSCIGNLGKVGLNAVPVAFNQQINAILPDEDKAIADFIFYQVLSGSFKSQLEALASGTTVPIVNKSKFNTIEIVLPPLPEQQRIVGILDEAFEGIATAKANAEKNLQNARALFDSHLHSVFSQRGDSPIVPIGDVAEVFDGPHATPKTVDTGPVFLGISALQDGKINLGETRHVTQQDFLQWTRRVQPKAGDIVFSYETRLGQAAIIPEGLECCLGRRMGLVRVNRRQVNPQFFVYQYISSPFRKFLYSKTVHGATVDRIPLKKFPSFPISLPSLAEQERMTNRLNKLRAETQRLESIYQQKLAAMDELKKSLLHQAFTGAL